MYLMLGDFLPTVRPRLMGPGVVGLREKYAHGQLLVERALESVKSVEVMPGVHEADGSGL